MNIEKVLTDLAGPAGAKIHTARSRNDQVALDLRLYLRQAVKDCGKLLRSLRDYLCRKASSVGQTPMPGYTHLQRAQPILLAHHLLAYYHMLSRDQERLSDLYGRLDFMPLGSGALAGTGLPIQPQLVAKELGFGHLAPNSLDAVASRDHVLEFLSFGAILMTHLSRLAEDIVLWCSTEFGFAELPDDLSTSSSMMPQKKNPDGAELQRGKAGRVFGNLFTLLTVVKGLPMSYNRDLQEDKEPLFDTVETLKMVLPLAAAMVKDLKFNLSRLSEAAADPFAAATDLADHLVLKGLPFREAHSQVGQLVAYAVRKKRPLNCLLPEELLRFCPQASPTILLDLTVENILSARFTTPGGTAPKAVASQLKKALEQLKTEVKKGAI
jgi:argininosuccinate lyase